MVEVPLVVRGQFDDRRINQGLNKLQSKISQIGKVAATAFGAFITIQGIRMLGRMISGSIDYANALSTLDQKTAQVTQSSKELIDTIQDVTTNQLSVAEAAGVAAQAIQLFGQAGADTVGQLTTIAGQAATVFGKTIPEALNIMFQGIASGRATTLRQIGLFIDLEEAAENMAAEMGRSVEQLTEAELATSRLNAVLTAGDLAFGELSIDVNVVDRLTSSLSDLGNALIQLISGGNVESSLTGLSGAIERLTRGIQSLPGETLDRLRGSMTALAQAGLAAGILALSIHIGAAIKAAWGFTQALLALRGAAMVSNIAMNLLSSQMAAGAASRSMIAHFTQVEAVLMKARMAAAGTRNAFLALALPIAAVAAVIAVLIAINVSNARAQRELVKTARDLRDAYDELLNSMREMRTETETLSDSLEGLAEQTETTGEQMEWAQERVLALTREYPDLTRELGYAYDAEGNLITATGIVIDSISTLQGVVDAFSTAGFRTQINQAIQGLSDFYQAEILTAGITPAGDYPGGLTGAARWGGDFWQALVDTFTGGTETALDEITRSMEQDYGALLNLMRPPVEPVPSGGAGDRGGGGGGAAAEVVQSAMELKDALTGVTEGLGKFEKEALTPLERHIIILAEHIKAQADIWQAATDAAADLIRGKDEARIQEELFGGHRPATAGERASALAQRNKDFLASLTSLHERFFANLGDVLGRAFAAWGRTGGAPDVLGLAQGLIAPAAKRYGANIATALGFGKSFGPVAAGGIMGLGLWAVNRLMGEEPMKVEQPIDIRIVDINTQLMSFFNFRGMEPFAFSSGFRPVFEDGLY